jgi:hypothetical protein
MDASEEKDSEENEEYLDETERVKRILSPTTNELTNPP